MANTQRIRIEYEVGSDSDPATTAIALDFIANMRDTVWDSSVRFVGGEVLRMVPVSGDEAKHPPNRRRPTTDEDYMR